VKFSGLLTHAYPGPLPAYHPRSWVDVLLTGFGPDRMMFGSDWPVCTLSASYDAVYRSAQVATAKLSAAASPTSPSPGRPPAIDGPDGVLTAA
jgi:L-fuconolactonase